MQNTHDLLVGTLSIGTPSLFTYPDSRHPWRPRHGQACQEKRQQNFSRSAFIPDLTDPPWVSKDGF